MAVDWDYDTFASGVEIYLEDGNTITVKVDREGNYTVEWTKNSPAHKQAPPVVRRPPANPLT